MLGIDVTDCRRWLPFRCPPLVTTSAFTTTCNAVTFTDQMRWCFCERCIITFSEKTMKAMVDLSKGTRQDSLVNSGEYKQLTGKITLDKAGSVSTYFNLKGLMDFGASGYALPDNPFGGVGIATIYWSSTIYASSYARSVRFFQSGVFFNELLGNHNAAWLVRGGD